MFLTVLTQVFILLFLIAIGFFAAKTGIMTEAGAKSCTDIALILVTPCVIIKAFIREYSHELMKSLVNAFVLILLVQVLLVVLSLVIFHSKDKKRERVLRFGAIFANAGFMSLPLQQALLGADGLLYGSVYVVVFNLVVWSYGIFLMSGDKNYISPKKLITNPGLIGLAVGLVIFVFSVPLPEMITKTLDHMSAVYTPLPMFVIGYHLAQTNVFHALKDKGCLFAVFVSLIVYPLAALGLLYLLGVRGSLLVAIVIAVSAPVAAITTMFSSKFSVYTPLSVNMVSLSTLLSLGSMPLVITLAQCLA